MGWNSIGDEGITVIAIALRKSRIQTLLVGNCRITFSGAKELAIALSLNPSITVLGMWGNSITVEGAKLLLQSAVNNGVCKEVLTDYSNHNAVQGMMTALETRWEPKKKL